MCSNCNKQQRKKHTVKKNCVLLHLVSERSTFVKAEKFSLIYIFSPFRYKKTLDFPKACGDLSFIANLWYSRHIPNLAHNGSLILYEFS